MTCVDGSNAAVRANRSVLTHVRSKHTAVKGLITGFPCVALNDITHRKLMAAFGRWGSVLSVRGCVVKFSTQFQCEVDGGQPFFFGGGGGGSCQPNLLQQHIASAVNQLF